MRRRIGLVLVIISFSGLFIFLLLYFWPSPDSKWETYIEPGIYSASEEVNIENITYSLETYMWRDFMPKSPPDGKPLNILIKIHALQIEEIPSIITLERLWIIDGQAVSSTVATNEYQIYGNTFQMMFRDGPKWGPGIKIDVVVKLKITESGSYYLKAINQTIHRTD